MASFTWVELHILSLSAVNFLGVEIGRQNFSVISISLCIWRRFSAVTGARIMDSFAFLCTLPLFPAKASISSALQDQNIRFFGNPHCNKQGSFQKSCCTKTGIPYPVLYGTTYSHCCIHFGHKPLLRVPFIQQCPYPEKWFQVGDSTCAPKQTG